jgi:hypothetical protein
MSVSEALHGTRLKKLLNLSLMTNTDPCIRTCKVKHMKYNPTKWWEKWDIVIDVSQLCSHPNFHEFKEHLEEGMQRILCQQIAPYDDAAWNDDSRFAQVIFLGTNP